MNIRNIIIISAALALAACSSQDDPWGDKLDAPVAAQFSGNIENVATRASGTSWDAKDAIGITGGVYTNVKYVTAAGDGKFTPPNVSEAIFFKANQEETEFKAYYPYSDEYSKNSGIISASTESQTKADQAKFDFLWAKASASHDTPTANFTFSHKMTKLILNIQWNADNSGISRTEFESATFALGGVKLNGEFNTTTGEALATGTATEKWSLTAQSREEGDKKAIRSFNLILFPQSDGTQTENPTLTVIVTIGNQDYACDITPTLAPGTSYTYTITVKKVGLEVSTSNINNWVNGGSDYTGEATPKPYDPFNGHPAVLMREASGSTPALYFAECNIGADSPEDAGLYFWWGDLTGYHNATEFDFSENNTEIVTKSYKSFDQLTQEGIIKDGILAKNYDAAQTNWEGDWRMPTSDEWQWLIDNCVWAYCSVSDENLTFALNTSEEDKFTVETLYSGVTGFYCKSKETGQIVFFPAAGSFNTGIHDFYNYSGSYWSTIHRPSKDYAEYCRLAAEEGNKLFNNSADVGKEVTNMNVYIGASIRPVLTK